MIFKLLFLFSVLPAQAGVNAVATTPDIAWLMRRIGGESISVKSLAKSQDDYHFLDARPDFVLSAARADILCKVGAELEIGWLPKILDRAANKKIMLGGSGDCDLSRSVELGQIPTKPLDRSMGDAHGAGNPHFWLSPLQMAAASKEVEKRLALVQPNEAIKYKERRELLEKELLTLHARLKKKLEPLQKKKLLEYHKDFFYFLRDYQLESAGSVEETPGVAPSAAYLANLALEKKGHVALVLGTNHSQKKLLEKFQELSGIPSLSLPGSLSNPENPNAYVEWQESIVEAILLASP
jgi:zinc/manganese transport system substrate-binding protein